MEFVRGRTRTMLRTRLRSVFCLAYYSSACGFGLLSDGSAALHHRLSKFAALLLIVARLSESRGCLNTLRTLMRKATAPHQGSTDRRAVPNTDCWAQVLSTSQGIAAIVSVRNSERKLQHSSVQEHFVFDSTTHLSILLKPRLSKDEKNYT